MIGIDISDQTIKVVHLSVAHKKLLSHHMRVLPKGIIKSGVVADKKQMAEEIKGAFTSSNISLKTKDSIVASIPETQSFLRVIEIPVMDDFEVREAVRWEIAQHIPFGLENVYVDWQPASSHNHKVKEGHMEVEVGAAQRKVVDPLFDIISGMGLDLAACELESQAIVRALIASNRKEQEGILLIDIGNTSTNVIVYDYGATRFTASLTQGVIQLLQDVSASDTKIIMENLETMPKPLVEKVEKSISMFADALVKDIFGIVKFYNGIDPKHMVREIILTGGGSNLPGLDVVFLKYFTEVHIQRGNPWVNLLSGKHVIKPPLSLQESVRYCTAIGLAIRPIIPL